MKQLLVRIAIITGLLLGISVAQKYLITNHSVDWHTYIGDKEQALWQSFEQKGLPYAQFAALKDKKTVDRPSNAKQNVDAGIKELFYAIAQDFDVNPKTIALQKVSDGECEAWADKQTMVINEPLFLRLPHQAQRFVLAHELQHIIHNDHEDRYTFDTVMQQANVSGDTALDLERQFYRFQEERADVLAALKNQEYAQAYECCMQNYLATIGETDNPEHPKMTDRKKLAQRIAADMNTQLA